MNTGITLVQSVLATLVTVIALGSPLSGDDLPTVLGDFDADGTPTVADLTKLVNHLHGRPVLPAELVPFADINQDSAVSVSDVELLIDMIMEREPLTLLPAALIAQTSPLDGEDNVAVTRETILRFSLPLAADASITTDELFATYAGRRLLGRVEVSSDRLKATLFHMENLPSSARIRVTLDSSGVTDYLGREVDADGDGQVGGVGTIEFSTLGITILPGTGMIGQVLAAEKDAGGNDIPLEGVIIEVVGAEETIRTTTAADGSFTLTPVPAGRFFVNVDGRPVTGLFPTGDYYPFVTKAWEAFPGKLDNLAAGTGIVYLPCVCEGSLETVSATEETEVGFPQEVLDANPDLAGVSLTVPPNSLFSNDGSRGGMIGIAPVPADRLPEPLPPDLNPDFVITVQTDGASNFDVPVPVRFPNRPNPETGEPLPPGEKTLLYSFNHDTGDWEIQGPMTVSPDGLFVESDPGVGIRQPGWGFVSPVPRVTLTVTLLLERRNRWRTFVRFRLSDDSGYSQVVNANFRRDQEYEGILRFQNDVKRFNEAKERWREWVERGRPRDRFGLPAPYNPIEDFFEPLIEAIDEALKGPKKNILIKPIPKAGAIRA